MVLLASRNFATLPPLWYELRFSYNKPPEKTGGLEDSLTKPADSLVMLDEVVSFFVVILQLVSKEMEAKKDVPCVTFLRSPYLQRLYLLNAPQFPENIIRSVKHLGCGFKSRSTEHQANMLLTEPAVVYIPKVSLFHHLINLWSLTKKIQMRGVEELKTSASNIQCTFEDVPQRRTQALVTPKLLASKFPAKATQMSKMFDLKCQTGHRFFTLARQWCGQSS